MNKKEFINQFRSCAGFLSENELNIVCDYLSENLQEDSKYQNPAGFSDNMKISFDVFKHLSNVEYQNHLDGVKNSISEAMNSIQKEEFAEFNDSAVLTPVLQLEKTELSSKTSDNKRSEGLLQRISALNGFTKIISVFLFTVCLILFLPILALSVVLSAFVYLIPVCVISIVALLILLIVISFAVLGIVALSYGLATLFTNTAVGLMEIGLGTVLFSVMLALWALNMQFFTFCIPFFCKKINLLFKTVVSKFFKFVFGGTDK
ncbi:MAG: hypothetical protein IJO74_05825 [Clostridia bacterium]|nr:hypothetical protein [Clostridia bacterium]